MTYLSIAAAQYPIGQFHSLSAWQQHLEAWVKNAQKAHLLLFPEYGAMELVSLFSANIQADLQAQIQAIQPLVSDFCAIFAHLARKYDTIIVAPSLPIQVGERFVNRAYVFSKKGRIGYQDKCLMTRFENEEWGISSPEEKILSLFETDWGAFGIQICYDVEFSLPSQLLCEAGATLLLAPSCTETIRGATRVHIGARARALENQCYTVVAQTVGMATWSPAVDVNYGYAAFYSTPDAFLPEEGILKKGQANEIGWQIVDLDLSLIEKVRTKGQVFNFKDHQRLSIGREEQPFSVAKFFV